MAPTSLEKAAYDRTCCSSNVDLLEQEVKDNDVTPLQEAVVNHYLGMSKQLQTDVMEIHKRILIHSPAGADIDPDKLIYSDLFKRTTKLIGAFTGLKMKFPVISNSNTTQPPPQPHPTEMRLPRLELPTFDGTLQDWVPFRDMFVTAVHGNVSLSKSQKLTYLKSQLKGEASRQISSMLISDANYDIAWAQLSDRYQNERELLFAILRRFMGQPVVQAHSASAVRKLVDVSRECIRSLDVLQLPTDQWDAIILFHLVSKMDSASKELWEQSLTDSSIPTLKSLFDFLEQRARALGASGSDPTPSRTSRPAPSGGVQTRSQSRNLVHHTSQSSGNCKCCEKGQHPLYKCDKFIGLSTQQRNDLIRLIKLCFNCFGNHRVSECTSTQSCRTCHARHHTLLHKAAVHVPNTNQTSAPDPVVHFINQDKAGSRPNEYDTLLATCLIQVADKQGQYHQFRVLADSGSNTNYVTESCIRKIGAPRRRCVTSATGLGGVSVANSSGVTQFVISPHFDTSLSFDITRCLITTKITGQLPTSLFDHTKWSHLQGLQLADPGYFKPQDVDMLLGAEFFFGILESGRSKGPPNSPVAVSTSFGWLIGGGSCDVSLINPNVHAILSNGPSTTVESSSAASDQDEHLDTTLRRFWEMESEPLQRLPTAEETAIDSHFMATHSRDETGRFAVQLPLKTPPIKIGSSFNIARKRLLYLERRLAKNPEHKNEYLKFMREYESLGHMEEVQPLEPTVDPSTVCYIPHHFVQKLSSTTTKFRVVFDASAKTSNGISLNETMMVGPTIQDPLIDILIRFRLHKVAFTADIEKMYRQIAMSSKPVELRILWREDPNGPIKHYRILTVMYGSAAAPYLATRVLQELATIYQQHLPRASKVTRRDLYVDDLMSGEPSVTDALNTQKELLQLMENGAMSLRKWSSNSQELLDALPPEMRETQSVLTIDTDSTVKTLGICWNPKADHFLFTVSPISTNSFETKRTVLSELARLFDPVGWLSPVVIRGKILMQSLWKLNQGWDAALPEEIQQQWAQFRNDIEGLSQLSIPRCYFHGSSIRCPSLNQANNQADPVTFCLAGFCDSSEKAYAAAVYLCAYQNNDSTVSLITSKTRVAPLKTVSLPRLELCGAALLAEVMAAVQSSLKIPIHSISAWTDSTVTLAWIQANPSKWKTFVANRVTKIQERIPAILWGHVKGEENPADCPSRGICCDDLVNHPLWWNGPSWLKNGIPEPPILSNLNHELASSEERQQVILHTMSEPNQSLLEQFSSLSKLLRVTAFVFRFITRIRQQGKEDSQTTGNPRTCLKTIPEVPPLTPIELEQARSYWIRTIQQQEFFQELHCLRNGKPISTKSKLLSLSPFIDADGLLKVGGRLRNSALPMKQRHPILLPCYNLFTQLLIDEEHHKYFHAGPQLLISILHQRYWIMRIKDAVRRRIRKCVLCTRLKAQTLQQVMGDLPAFRVTPARPFSKTGVDYAGPFLLRPIQPRSKTTIKAYLAVFVCCTTRAIHLEVVSSLTTDAFLAALRRFTSRRGRPSDIYSDCGSNFIGADRELKEMMKLTQSKSHNQDVANQLSKDGILWHFQPPASPHFGGHFEAGVKSVKFHLRRIMGLQRLTFEELTTVVTQIEAILNSRPLTPETTNPDDLSALTPGHFLIGAPMNAVPDPDLEHLNTNRLSRWQLLQQLVQSFWKRWSGEYLTRLQQRPKWMTGDRKLLVGDMVIIKDENLPPLKWKLGRIIALHPGADSVVRVVTIKTSTGQLKRPVVKICLLPVEHSTPTPP